MERAFFQLSTMSKFIGIHHCLGELYLIQFNCSFVSRSKALSKRGTSTCFCCMDKHDYLLVIGGEKKNENAT